MNVSGTLAAPEIFSLRAAEPPGGIDVTIDITRIILHGECTATPTLGEFGDLNKLTNGLVFRRTDGTNQNIFNVKSNLDLAGIAYDFEIYDASVSSQGLNGFTCRLTFAGQNKMGVAIRIGKNEDIEMLVQDNLTGLVSFQVTVEGHVVVP
jgi:hypothetical protein